MAEKLNLKQQALNKLFSHLNPMQREAIFQTEGPLLILAGAGSGKTTVLINRVRYMVQIGNSYHSPQPNYSQAEINLLEDYLNGKVTNEDEVIPLLRANPIRPWNVLAITFTNKAAEELRIRLGESLGEDVAAEIQASTFHSLCMRILRRYIGDLGYESNFTIYDTDDSLRVIKDGIKAVGVNDKQFPPRSILSAISKAKDDLTTPEDMLRDTQTDYRAHSIAKIYKYYQDTLKNANALDFDDIIVLTVRLFQQNPEALEYYQNRYRYIMVDEYQDTNQSQYLLVSYLANKYENLCVVGDDDQSIYKFRGATIENILSFENQFKGAKVIRLEQNYRSTQNILTSANTLIENNTGRKGKNLWTDAGSGEKVQIVNLSDEREEAKYIADSILDNVADGAEWNHHAILYRMNAQSSSIERALAQRAVPYRIIGGLRFYERKEIKDIIAYLAVMNNPNDDLRLVRIANEPRRGIGATTIENASEIAQGLGESMVNIFKTADQYPALSRTANALGDFVKIMESISSNVNEVPLDQLLDILLEETGYLAMLEAEGDEGITRIENVMELKSNMLEYEANAEEPSLAGFLEEISLYTDLDNYDEEANTVVLMTIHSAKGLEFPTVIVAGMEEGIFPGRNAHSFPEELEEERRLAYVAVTRAEDQLVLTHADRRMIFGRTEHSRPSRFLKELPDETVQHVSNVVDLGFSRRPEKQQVSFATKSTAGIERKAPPQKSDANINVGDKVSHQVFGEGVVLSAKPMGGDTLLEINFDKTGNKKVMANFARLVKL